MVDLASVWDRLARDVIEPPARALALGWATVDLDRAAADLDRLLGPGPEPRPATRSAALGATCRVRSASERDPLQVVLLEPDTEGRLAATLARVGEGWVVAWANLDESALMNQAGRRALGEAWSAARPGPFGSERLWRSDGVAGPHRLVVAPATIQSMTDEPISIRAATALDAEAIAALFTDEGYPAGPSDIVARLAQFDGPRSQVLVAEHEGSVLGFVAWHAIPRFEHDDSIVRIVALVVDPGARERGVGRGLIAAAEAAGRGLGGAFAEITAGQKRPEARRLYETLGYVANVAAYLRKKL